MCERSMSEYRSWREARASDRFRATRKNSLTIAAWGTSRSSAKLPARFLGAMQSQRTFFRERLALLEEMYREKRFGSWAALVTNDFFYDDANLEMAKKSGCVALFSGVESFDTAWLSSMNKRQNARLPQVEMISKCLRAGIIFLYGMLLDVTSRRVDDLD